MNDQIFMPINEVKNPFLFIDSEVRTATAENGEAFFCAKDVFKALDICWNGARSLKNVRKKWQLVVYRTTSFGEKETIFVHEAAVYVIATRSNKPNAEKFTDWLFEDVVPTLRRQGYYGNLTEGQQFKYREQKLRLIQQLNHCRDQFSFEAVLDSLRNVCNLLGEPMPATSKIGKKVEQLAFDI